jgi:hypothetical protein
LRLSDRSLSELEVKDLLGRLSMVGHSSLLPPLSFGLKSERTKRKHLSVTLPSLWVKREVGANDGAPLESWCASVEHEHGLDPMKQQLVDPPQEAEYVRIDERLPFLVLHRCLELGRAKEEDVRCPQQGEQGQGTRRTW